MFGDKLAWAEAQSRAQMTALAHAIDRDIQNLRNILFLSYSEVETAKKDFSANRPYSRFQMMSKILPPNRKDDKKDWQVVSSFYQEGSPTKSWASAYVTLALKTIKESDVRPGSANVYSLMDPSRKPFLLLLARGTSNWYAGLLGTEVFQSLMDRQTGQKSNVFLVNLQGQALGHTTQEYVGNLLTEDPLVSELMKSSVGSGFGTFRDLKGESVQGLYEQVENTNIYAVITTPLKSLLADRESVRWQLALMGMGLAMVGLAIFVLQDRSGGRRRPSAPASSQPSYLAPAAPAPASVNSDSLPSGTERMKAYTQVASSLSHELKPPLTAILGHAQVARQQTGEGAQAHLEQIENEARSARDIIQKLLIFAGEDKLPSQKMGLDTVLQKALKNVEGKVLSKGIKLTKQIDSVPHFTMSGDLVVKAIENLLLNSIEAMERAPKKEMTVILRPEGSSILLSLADTGEGISATDLGKIFDPFFTTRSGSQHVGLGLSTALGIFREIFGEVQVDSEKGKGTTVKVIFNPQTALHAAAAPNEKPTPVVPRAPAKPAAAAPTTEVKLDFSAKNKTERMALDPILVDNSIERLIEDEPMDMPEMPKPENFIDKVAAVAPATTTPTPAPAQPRQEEEPVPVLLDSPTKINAKKGGFSAKIDKPNIEIKKKSSALDEVQVAIRRPGERL